MTILIFDQANHWFAPATTGSTAEMRAQISQGAGARYDFTPGFLETIAAWIKDQTCPQQTPTCIPVVAGGSEPVLLTAGHPHPRLPMTRESRKEN